VRRLGKLLGRESDNILETNIFRDAWQIGNLYNPTEKDHDSVPAAWEEKATLYWESRGGIEFGELEIPI
jgi:hypothetical protein